jgi:hypothetical protein
MATTGDSVLRSENIEAMVKGFALQEYTMKQVVMQSTSTSWQESYYQETATELTAKGTRKIKGVARLAAFPYGEVNWEQKSAYMQKYGLEGTVSYEDERMNNIDVIARTLLRIARGVAKAVDDEIWEVISENQTPVNINSEAITAGDEWDSATIANRDPIQNILNSRSAIRKYNYNISNGFLLLNPTDESNLLGNANIRNAGQFYTDAVTKNGVIGRAFGLTFIVSNSVTDDYAMVIANKEAANWKSANPLTVVTIDDPGIKKTIRAWEIGVTQLINPKAITLISNTQA